MSFISAIASRLIIVHQYHDLHLIVLAVPFLPHHDLIKAFSWSRLWNS